MLLIARPCGMYPLALHLPQPNDDEKKYSAHMSVTVADIRRPWGTYPLVLALPHAEKKYKVHPMAVALTTQCLVVAKQ